VVGRSIVLFAVIRAVSCAQTGGIQGRVADIANAAIPNAVVELRIKADSTPLQTTKTDWPGHYSFTDVPAGTYELLVSAPGFQPYTQSIKVTKGREIDLPAISLTVAPIGGCDQSPPDLPTINFEATKSGKTLLDGAVVGKGGEFLAGVKLTLSPIGKNARQWEMLTGPWGSFSFGGVTPGMYSLRATRRGYADFVIDRFEIKPGWRTHIVDSLEMLNCLEGFQCEPNRKIHAVVLCL
jgi:hypothetical protein